MKLITIAYRVGIMAGNENIEQHISAGGVVYRTNGGMIETVLCGRSNPRKWSLPKGTPDEGETVEQTALREVNEETGLEVEIQEAIGDITYWFIRPTDGVRCHKVVHYFLMRPTGGATDKHDHEFDEVRWFPGEEALRILNYANDASIVEKALTRVREVTSIG